MESKKSNKTLDEPRTEITVFTGFLGAGKTTIITSLLSQIDSSSIFILKNEFGDNKIDSELLQTSISGVKEIINGCLCCVLVGQLKEALIEIRRDFKPNRIIIETSGSAFPGPIAWQIREMDEFFKLDSIITVVDCQNFMVGFHVYLGILMITKGYEDTSYTAKLQAKYSDLILFTKHELVSERQFDLVLDRVNDLNTDTPKLKWGKDTRVDARLLFGIETKLFKDFDTNLDRDKSHHDREVELIHIAQASPVDMAALENLLSLLPKDTIYRIKGTFHGGMVLNWAFGRYEWIKVEKIYTKLNVTVMGQELQMVVEKLSTVFDRECIIKS